MATHLHFDTETSIKKPETIKSKGNPCPFCEIHKLTGIIATQDSMILLKNKYQTLKNTFQTVLIETDECGSELSAYPKEHLYKLFRFAITQLLEMEKRSEFKSVILYKNHGPLSGGSIRHPHMQIIGLENIDYMAAVKPEYFIGELIHKSETVEFNVSTMPKVGFYELNVLLSDLGDTDKMADCVQAAAHFILNHFHFKCESYNLFFYHFNGILACKITPRFATSPFYIGYSIPQVPENIGLVAGRIRELYQFN